MPDAVERHEHAYEMCARRHEGRGCAERRTDAGERALGGELLDLGADRGGAGVAVAADNGGDQAGDVGGRLFAPMVSGSIRQGLRTGRTIDVPEMLFVV